MASLMTRDPLEDFFRGFLVRPIGLEANGESPTIRVDISEDSQQYTVHAELPGMNKDDIHVHVENGVVSISAESRQDKVVKEGERILRTERRFGKASRTLHLGTDVDDAHASAKYVNGLLVLNLPKKVVTQAKRLKIE